MPPFEPPDAIHGPVKSALNVSVMWCWSAASCAIVSFDQSAGDGRDPAKNRCSTTIWLPRSSPVGSAGKSSQ
jgi:hypothetical protein